MKSMALEGTSRPVLCCGCVQKLTGPCRGILRYFTLGHPIHPVQQTAPSHSEFISLRPKVRIRVIHVKPDDQTVLKEEYPCFSFNAKRLSLSEEYWFTRWNKPLKTGICNCSFRRSLRYSTILDTKNNSNRLSNFDIPPTRITNVDTFVERLVQETLFEALQEYVMNKNVKFNPNNVKQGVSNTSYEVSEDDIDGIFLRSGSNKSAAVLPTDCVTVEIRKNLEQKSSICEHKTNVKKVNVSVMFITIKALNTFILETANFFITRNWLYSRFLVGYN